MYQKRAPLIALGIIAITLFLAVMWGRQQPIEASSEDSKDSLMMSEEFSQASKPQSDDLATPPAPEAERPQDGEPIYSSGEFESFTQQFRNELPPMTVLRNQPKHALHPGLMKAYSRSGKIARAAIRQPELRETAFGALEFCANLKNYDTSVRAMCLRQHRKIREATGDTSFDERNRINELPVLDSLLKRSFDD